MSPRGRKPVAVVEGQMVLHPDKPIEFQQYEVELDQIDDPLLGAVNVDKQFVLSIMRFGVLQPVLLRKVAKEGPPKYRVIAGRRRVAACQSIMGMSRIPARIPTNDEGWTDDALLALIENEQRSDNPVATLAQIEDMMTRGYNEKDIAKAVGIDVKIVRKYLGLQRLNPRLMAAFVAGEIAVGVADQASKLPAAYQAKLADIIKDTGKLKGADIRTVKEIKKEDVERGLPDSLFDKEDFIDRISERDEIVAKGNELIDRLIVLFPGLEGDFMALKDLIEREGAVGIADVPDIEAVETPVLPQPQTNDEGEVIGEPVDWKPPADHHDNLMGATVTAPYDGTVRVPIVTSTGNKEDPFQMVNPEDDDAPY